MLEYRYYVPFKFTGKIDKLTFKPRTGAGHASEALAASSIANRVAGAEY